MSGGSEAQISRTEQCLGSSIDVPLARAGWLEEGLKNKERKSPGVVKADG